MRVFQGGLAAGSALSGALAARAGISMHCCGRHRIMATTALGLVAKLPGRATDVSHGITGGCRPSSRPSAELDEGPVLVTLEYRVNHDQSEEFLEAIHEYGRVRRRDGAVPVGVYRILKTRIGTSKRSSSGMGRTPSSARALDRKAIAKSEPVANVCDRRPKVRHLVAVTQTLRMMPHRKRTSTV